MTGATTLYLSSNPRERQGETESMTQQLERIHTPIYCLFLGDLRLCNLSMNLDRNPSFLTLSS